MTDRPTSGEILQAVREFLDGQLLPALVDSRQRFQVLIASNLLAIVERELAIGDRLSAEDAEEIAALLGSEALIKPHGQENLVRQLADGLRAASGSLLSAPALPGVLRRHVERKLKVANPKYLESAR